jgi:hypothetical protein
MIRSRPLFLFTVAALLGMRPVSAADTCFVRAVIGGKAAELKNCALAVYDEKGATIFFSESPIGAEERAAFELNSYPKDTDPSGKPRTMMHVAFCPGGGKSVADPAAVTSVELSMSSASSGMLQRQWVFELPRDAGELKIEKLAGTLGPGGRLSGRISGGRTSDGLKYSWAADFDLAIPGKQAVAGAGCGD